MLRVLFFQAAQPRGQRAAPDPHPAARQPHDRRPGSLPAPAVESRPGHPQLGDHLLDHQQRVIRGTGCSVRGGGGPAGSGWRSRGRPVRGSATTDAPLRPACQVRPPPGRPGRTAARGCGETGKKEGPRRRGRADWRAAWSCRRGRRAGPGAGSRTVADGTLPLSAGWRGGLASRPGPQASTRTSPRHVKSAPPSTGTGLTPGPEPRVDTAQYPPRTNKGTGRPWAGHREGGTVARARAARATVALALRADRLPDESVPACRQHVALPEGSVMGRVGPACRPFVRYYRNPVFRAFFHVLPENRLVRDRHTRLAAAPIHSRSARRSRSGGEQLDLEVPGEHLDEIQWLGYGPEIAPGPAPEGVGRDAERGADGDLAPCEVAWAPWR